MEQPTENKQQPTPSRTLRISTSSYDTSKYDYPNVQNGNVYFLTFDKLEDGVSAYERLKDDKLPVRYHVYSLFTKFDQPITKEELETKVRTIIGNQDSIITYARVDTKDTPVTHTGKVVIDRLADCKTLLSYKDEGASHLRFYRFDPKKAIKRTMTTPVTIFEKSDRQRNSHPRTSRPRRVVSRTAEV